MPPAARAIESDPSRTVAVLDDHDAFAGQTVRDQVGGIYNSDDAEATPREPRPPPKRQRFARGCANHACHLCPRNGARSPAPMKPSAGSQ